MSDLKPCPACESTDIIYDGENTCAWGCENCGVRGAWWDDNGAKWNAMPRLIGELSPAALQQAAEASAKVVRDIMGPPPDPDFGHLVMLTAEALTGVVLPDDIIEVTDVKKACDIARAALAELKKGRV